MHAAFVYSCVGLVTFVLAGCASTRHSHDSANHEANFEPPSTIQAGYESSSKLDGDAFTLQFVEETSRVQPQEVAIAEYGLQELSQLALESNPRLEKVEWAVETARGVAWQAGMYPNPTLRITGNELGDRTGPAGLWSAYMEQEVVTVNKLGFDHAAELRQVDQASLDVMSERYRVLTEVRQAFFDALILQQRFDVMDELVELAEQSVENANLLLNAQEAAELDVIQLEVDLERYRADLESTRRSLPAAYTKLAASVGDGEMYISRLVGDLDAPSPGYELSDVQNYVLGIHPELRSAQVGVEKAKLALQRAEVEAIPNITIGTGYTYQGQNRSSDWDIGVSLPLPVWDKNQGNIRASHAKVHQAINEVDRVENDLVRRLADAHSVYSSARERTHRYMDSILPRAVRTLELSRGAYQGGQSEYLGVLQAQSAVAEANLELIRSQGELWRSASEIAGLMLEDQWPTGPTEANQQR